MSSDFSLLISEWFRMPVSLHDRDEAELRIAAIRLGIVALHRCTDRGRANKRVQLTGRSSDNWRAVKSRDDREGLAMNKGRTRIRHGGTKVATGPHPSVPWAL